MLTCRATSDAMDSRIASDDSTLASLQEMVQEERGKAIGRTKVAQFSLEMNDPASKDIDKKTLADLALTEFAARENLRRAR